uniref:Uncharacterized protein n=1 Tax=viral metagenome TaxID=1070528 RepID=A0A6C0HS12_9ZZZZ
MSTRKNKDSSIIQHFMEMINTIKLYHWKTYSFPEHKNTDELHKTLSEHVDKFVEVLLGKHGGRINKKEFQFKCVNYSSSKEFKKYIEKTLFYLSTFNHTFKNDSDLLNIRDEMVADLNQFLYLLSFK